MRVRVFGSLLVLLFVGGTGTAALPADDVQLTPPPALVESLAWHQDPVAMLRAFRVPRASSGRTSNAVGSRATAALRLDGKDRTWLGRGPGALADVPIAADTSLIETQPSLAASPGRQDLVALAYVAAAFPTSPGTRCFVARSLDRGRTWTRRAQLPALSPTSNCADPALAYSPDGSRLYAAYRDILTVQEFLPENLFRIETATNVVVAQSRDDGRTWSAPVVALVAKAYSVTYECPGGLETCGEPIDWTPGTSFERPSVAVSGTAHRGRRAQPGEWVVHVASTRLAELDDTATPTTIVVTRSLSKGTDWSPVRELDAGHSSGPQVITQGPRVTVGNDSEVLVAWYHSGFDGFLAGGFEIRTARSGDHGTSWDPNVTAAADSSEAPLSLFPFRKWWTTMFPDAVIDADGRAHVVYTHDPEAESTTAEEGDVRYVGSLISPYADWSDPVTVNDDGPGRAQGFVSLVTRRQVRGTVVEAVWEDTRLAPDGSTPAGISLYDVFHARLEPGQGTGWSANTRVTDASSTQTQTFAAGRTSVTANGTGVVFAAWSDRRGVGSTADPASDVYGSRIAPR